MRVDIFETNKKYNIIYADPPWEYKESGGGHRGTAGLPYETMATESICSLPIDKIAEENSFLYLWATDTKLPQALDVMKSWGYTYKGIVYVWVKHKDYVLFFSNVKKITWEFLY
jgi:site-specific DNA-methyltransferase (adenine-specific)